MVKLTLPTDSDERKNVPVLSGCMNYAPAALAWFARISVKGDRKHNPENAGNPPFHARGKSMDHGDCIVRHTMDIEDLKAHLRRLDERAEITPADYVTKIRKQLLEEAAYRFWRAGVELQEMCERYDGAPLAPAARLPDAQHGFAGQVQAQYEANVAALGAGNGLVAGSATVGLQQSVAQRYEPPQLKARPELNLNPAGIVIPPDREAQMVERMRKRVQETSG